MSARIPLSPDPEPFSLAIAAILAAAGREPDEDGDYMWIWEAGPEYLRADYWWFDTTEIREAGLIRAGSWTLVTGPCLTRSTLVAGPDLADVLAKLQDPKIREQFNLGQENERP